MQTDRTQRYRERARLDELPRRYSGTLHMLGTNAFALGGAGAALLQVAAPTAWELAIVPLSFVAANLAEYLVHRGPMHHRRKGLEKLFLNHARRHHAFFTHDRMAGDSADDVYFTLFHPRLLAFFAVVFAAPVGLLLGALLSANCAWLFLGTTFLYFWSYEWLHYAYHAPERSPLRRLPLVGRLARHHAVHHDPSMMSDWNFNITYPIFDLLLGTAAVKPWRSPVTFSRGKVPLRDERPS